MSADLLVACTETEFRFDPAALRDSALTRWPQVEFHQPQPRMAEKFDQDIHVIGPDGTLESEISVHRSGGAVGLDCRTPEAAADVLAWLAAMPGLPDDDVIVTDWQSSLYPLRPGISAAELLADRHS